MKTESVPTSALREGDRVRHYGMTLLIDQAPRQSKAHPVDETCGAVLYSRALIENWEEVSRLADEGHSIMQFIAGLARSDLFYGRSTEPRWTIQGNDWATWARVVEEA